MQDEAKDIRCGLILNISVNKSVIYEYIDEEMINLYLCDEWEFAKCGDITYEGMFMEEFKDQYIHVLNNSNDNCDLNHEVWLIISNMVNEYMASKMLKKVT